MLRDKIAEIRKACPHCKELTWMELLNMECGVAGTEREIHFSANINPKSTKYYNKKSLLDEFDVKQYGLTE